MRDFNRNDRRDDRSGGRRDFGSREPREMFKATCSNCGNACEVPFKPTGSKPIFCNNCFKDHGDHSAPRRSEGGNFRPQSNFEDRTMYDAVCDSCGSKGRVPFEPRNGKPVYCSNCFEKRGSQDFRQSTPTVDRTQYPQYKEQFDKLNAKLDKLINLLSTSESTSVPSEELVVEEIEKIEEPQKAKKTTKPAKKKSTSSKNLANAQEI